MLPATPLVSRPWEPMAMPTPSPSLWLPTPLSPNRKEKKNS